MTPGRIRSTAIRMIYGVVVVTLVAGAFFALRQSVPELQRKRQRVHELEKQNAEIVREIQLKKDYMHEFDTNPEVPKTLIRQKLDRYRPDAKEYRYKHAEPRP